MKNLLTSLAIVTLAGCATYKPIPENYAGPIATVIDSGKYEDSTKAQIFAITEIDGHSIRDSFSTSHQASYGQGATLRLELTERQVPARVMKVKIRGSHATGAPIQELASKAIGTFFEVEGVVEFNPQADKRYIVVGVLSKQDSAVWIEDEATHQPVTPKVTNQH
ncbi:MAG: hypothetical protein QM749_07720 [Aquabacterium sp.]